MPKFKITTIFRQQGNYFLEAKNAEEAEEKWNNGDWDNYQDKLNNLVDAQEEIVSVKEIKKIEEVVI